MQKVPEFHAQLQEEKCETVWRVCVCVVVVGGAGMSGCMHVRGWRTRYAVCGWVRWYDTMTGHAGTQPVGQLFMVPHYWGGV